MMRQKELEKKANYHQALNLCLLRHQLNKKVLFRDRILSNLSIIKMIMVEDLMKILNRKIELQIIDSYNNQCTIKEATLNCKCNSNSLTLLLLNKLKAHRLLQCLFNQGESDIHPTFLNNKYFKCNNKHNALLILNHHRIQITSQLHLEQISQRKLYQLYTIFRKSLEKLLSRLTLHYLYLMSGKL